MKPGTYERIASRIEHGTRSVWDSLYSCPDMQDPIRRRESVSKEFFGRPNGPEYHASMLREFRVFGSRRVENLVHRYFLEAGMEIAAVTNGVHEGSREPYSGVAVARSGDFDSEGFRRYMEKHEKFLKAALEGQG